MHDPTQPGCDDSARDLSLRPVPAQDGRAPDAATARKPHPKQRTNPARVQRMRALPQGVYQDRRRPHHRESFIARLWHGSDHEHIGTFRTVKEAAYAVAKAKREFRAEERKTPEERAVMRAFQALRKSPGIWHLRDLTFAEQVAKIQTFSPTLRMLVLNYVPAEDDPILAVAENAPEPLTLQEIAHLYGCSRERIRQIEEATLVRLTRFNRPDLELMLPTERVTHWDNMGVV